MFDEMKLKQDIYWNCSNNRMVGLAASHDGIDKLLAEDEISTLFREVFDAGGHILSGRSLW